MSVVRTLHRAGNRARPPLLAGAPVDAIEADAWVVQGHVVLQHARPLGSLPISLHRRGLFFEPQRRTLERLLANLDAPVAVVLDVRSWVNDPAPDVFSAISALDLGPAAVSFAAEAWDTADRLRAWLPEHRSAYSVRSELQLRRYIEGCAAGALPEAPIAIRHTLLHDRAAVAALHRFAPRVAAWTVDDPQRAGDLAAWGVDEIVSNRIEVLATL